MYLQGAGGGKTAIGRSPSGGGVHVHLQQQLSLVITVGYMLYLLRGCLYDSRLVPFTPRFAIVKVFITV